MDKKTILGSNHLKKRFCTECRIPVGVYDNPYFSSRIDTFEPFYDSKKKFARFCNSLKPYKSEQEYGEDYNRIKEAMIQVIRENPAYGEFVANIPNLNVTYPKKELYSPDNAPGWYISIDMSAANFNAVRHFNPDIFGGAETWQDFARRFTDNEHIIESKYIRQVIMGACNPKAQTRYETYLMATLLDHIVKNLPNVVVFSLGTDEIILEIPASGCGFSINHLERVIFSEPNGIGKIVKIQCFQLRRIKGTDGYIRVDYNGAVQFKNLPKKLMIQVVKHYLEMPINDIDLVFYDDGRLARYIEPIPNPFATDEN